MSDDDFLEAIRRSPHDTLVRLAYADWLEDQRDPRARFLRVDTALVERCADPKFSPEKNLDAGMEWDVVAHGIDRHWLAEASIPCDLWLVKAPLRAKRMLLGRVRNSLGVDLQRAREAMDTLPCRIVVAAPLGTAFQWLENTGIRRKSPDASRPRLSALSSMVVKYRITRSS